MINELLWNINLMEVRPIDNHKIMIKCWNKITNTCVHKWLKYFSKGGSVELRSVEMVVLKKEW